MDLEPWREKAKKLKNEIYALYFPYRDPQVSWYAKDDSRIMPEAVLEECREKAQCESVGNHWVVAVVIILIWQLSM